MAPAISVCKVVISVGDRRKGHLIVGAAVFACAIGRSGRVVMKREGDGGTPRTALPIRRVFYRADRVRRPHCRFPVRAIRPDEAWCDDLTDRRYNRLIRRPPGAAEERLWREDALYDVIVELGWNDRPVRKGRGSAIFWHLARPGFLPTAGCIAVEKDTFYKILSRLSKESVIRIL